MYPSVQAKAAQLCYGLVKNHAMIDGNKRIGTHVMLVFLALNSYELSYSQKLVEDCLDELQPFIDDVVPQDNESNTDFSEDGYLDDINSFLS